MKKLIEEQVICMKQGVFDALYYPVIQELTAVKRY